MERKLASIRKIKAIDPIPGADAIEVATVDGWKVVVAKSVGHKVDDLVVYCEVDSFLPIEPEFEFLRKSSYKKMGDKEGFRLKTIKLRGQVSQGLIVPLKDAYSLYQRLVPNLTMEWFEGLDVTAMLNIEKYEAPIPAELSGKVAGGFPSFIPKTDEERIQNLVWDYENHYVYSKMFSTEKLDGTSVTYYLNQGKFGVCSRNWEMAEPEPFVEGEMIMCDDGIERPRKENTYWKMARVHDIEDRLRKLGRNIAIQGEIIGEGIQGNPYKLKGQRVYFYNVFDIDTQSRLGMIDFKNTIFDLGLNTVPILDLFDIGELGTKVEHVLEYAEGRSKLNPDVENEGVVIRDINGKFSFKAISNKFLLQEK